MATQQAAPSNAGAAADPLAQLLASNPAVAAAYATAQTAGGGGLDIYGNPSSYVDPKALIYTGAPGLGAKPTYTHVTKGWVGRNGADPSFLIPNGDQYTTIMDPATGRQRLARDDPNLSLVDVGLNSSTGKWEVVNAAQVASAGDTTAAVGDTLKAFYSMSADELARTQRLLFAGGFYGTATLTDVPFGVADEASFSAWARAVSRAARMYGAGQKVTVDDVLAQAARAGGIGGTGAGAGKTTHISLTDPASLRTTIDSTAQAILGRKATVDEERMFVSLFHQMESGAQMATQGVDNAAGAGGMGAAPYDVTTTLPSDPRLNRGSVGTQGPGTAPSTSLQPRPDVTMEQLQAASPTQGGTTVATNPDASSQAAELLRKQHPEEAGAHDVATQFDNFIRLLHGVVH